MAPIALAFAVLDLTHSATDLGLVIAANEGAGVVVLLAAGVWADRLRRDRIMLTTDLVQFVSQGSTAALVLNGRAEIWQLIVLQVIGGAANGFFGPAANGLLPQIVTADKLLQANSLLSLTGSTVGIVGPASGGALVATGSPGIALLVDALTFLFSAVFVVRLRVARGDRDKRQGFVDDLRSGWSEFVRRRWLWMSVISFCGYNLFSFAPWFVLGAVVAKHHLGGAGAWGLVLAGGGVGSVIGGLVGLRFAPTRPLLVEQLLCLLWPAQLVFLAVLAPVPVLVAAATAGGIGLSLANTLWFTALQSKIPEHVISRVSSYDNLGSFIINPLSFALIGIFAARVGTTTAILLCAAGSAGSVGFALATPAIRDLTLDDGAVAKPEATGRL